ncbi:MAG: hypothetical protein U9N59_10245, partial [Campylobacterota bacterium]|nr:hypothetical protein [Campylobacterota bacterium]
KEKGILPIKDYHYDHVQKAIEFYEKELKGIVKQVTTVKVKHKNDKQALSILNGFRKSNIIEYELIELFIKTIELGKYQNLSKDIITISKKFKDFEKTKEIEKLQEKYSLVHQETKQKQQIKTNIDIVLSETFI